MTATGAASPATPDSATASRAPAGPWPVWQAGILAFFTSAAILVLEVLAGRLLAPYVGVTLQTYTAIIGVVLAGISLGSFVGGRLADRIDPRLLLGPALGIGGALALTAVPVVRAFADDADGGNVSVVVGLAAAGFFLPAVVLSTITPVLTKLQMSSLDATGRTVGTISALSTAGAIVGTFATGFLLVATISTTAITSLVGGALVVLGVVLTARARRHGRGDATRRSGRLSAASLAVIGAGALGANVTSHSRCDVESAYFCATVLTDSARPGGRILQLDNLEHSYVDLNDPTYLEFAYTQLFATALDTRSPGPVHAVHLGGGGFTMPRFIRATRPGSTNVVLERDPELPELVTQKLGWTRGADTTVRVGDGRVGLAALPTGTTDVLFGDAFGAEAVPWHLTTVEFTRDIHRVLKPNGIYVLNAIDSGPNRFVKAEVRTIAVIFRYVVVMAPPYAFNGDFGANFVIVASDSPIDTTALRAGITRRGTDALVRGGVVQDATGALPADLESFAARTGSAPRVLTDDYAPVDQLFTRSA